MEGAPFIPEYQNDDPERREKHIPKVETIGSLAVEANPEKDPDYRQQSQEHLGKALVSKEALQDKTETNFEQDPALRQQQNSNAASRVSASIGGLLKNADVDLGVQGSSSKTTQDTSSSVLTGAKQQRSMADVVMLSVIVLLLVLIILVIILKS